MSNNNYMPTTNVFNKLYKQLNEEQKTAVDAIEGPVMVVAGPGTGKTQILTLRIANILLRADIDPENVLALTFTESAVASMRKRLVSIIGVAGYRVNIATFHGFCNDIIKNNPENFPHIIGAESITEVDQIKIIEDIIDRGKFKILSPFGDLYYYIRAILSALNNLKREDISPENFKEKIELEKKSFKQIDDLFHEKGAFKGKMKSKYQDLEKQISKTQELAIIYSKYQDELKNRKKYDYSDMIIEVLKMFREDDNLLLSQQEKYQYILVDEHQDTNNAQNKIIELMGNFHDNPNIFIVGDEKQAIFRFQGASIENFFYFKKLYSGAKLINLKHNYRSTQNILDSAENIISGDFKLISNTKGDHLLNVFSLSNNETEGHFIASDIAKKINEGASPEDIAVLYRDNRDAFIIANSMDRVGVPYSIKSDQNILGDNEIRKFISLLDAVSNFGLPEKAVEILHIDFFKIPPLDVYKIINNAGINKINIYEVINSYKILNSLGLESAEKISDLYKKIERWAIMAKNNPPGEVFEEIAYDSGFVKHILSLDDGADKLGKFQSLFNELKLLSQAHIGSRISDFVNYLKTLEQHNILVKNRSILQSKGRVQLMTAHKSKGMEFDHVYIAGAYDGHWGNRRIRELLPLPGSIYSLSGQKIGKEQKNEDERRLFYVAITRAKREVTITYPEEDENGRELISSQFINEIKPEIINNKISQKSPHQSSDFSIIKKPTNLNKINKIKDEGFVRELFLQRGFSVTGLNNYLSCPWKYFYQNLLRIPKVPQKHQLYGIAVHAALKDLFDSIKEGLISKQYLLDRFKVHLERQPLEANQIEEILIKGEKSLGGYFDLYKDSWEKDVKTEVYIQDIKLNDEIRLTGVLDKIEGINSGKKVNVVDYKTGKPKSRNQIEGKTKSSDGSMKRQLVFYKLLLDEYFEGKKIMVSGEIDFIEPAPSNKYKKEKFLISSEEVEELKQLILKVSDEILNLKFWDKRCDDKKCEFCNLQGHLGA